MAEDNPGFYQYPGEGMSVSMSESARLLGVTRQRVEQMVKESGIETFRYNDMPGRPRYLNLAQLFRWRCERYPKRSGGVTIWLTDMFISIDGIRYELRTERDFVMLLYFTKSVCREYDYNTPDP